MFAKIIRNLFRPKESSDSSAHAGAEAQSEVALPPRPLTKMEASLGRDFRASFQVIDPSREDLTNAEKLPPGSLRSVWTEFRGRNDSSVDATFVGHGAHSEGPYVLLRAKHQNLYLYEQVKAELQRIAGVGEQTNSVRPDEVSVVIHFERESGLTARYSDVKHIRRVLQLMALPPSDVAEVVLTRLFLEPVQVGLVARADRLGDRGYEVDFFGSTPQVTVGREALAEAA